MAQVPAARRMSTPGRHAWANASSSASTCLSVVRCRQSHAQPRSPGWHGRGADCRDPEAGRHELLLRGQCSLGAAENERLNRVTGTVPSGSPSCVAPLRNRAVSSSTRSRRQDSRSEISSATRVAAASAWGMRRRVDVSARLLHQQLDQVGIPCRERPEGAERLAEGADEQRDIRRASRPKCSRLPRPVGPITPSPCASSTTSQA